MSNQQGKRIKELRTALNLSQDKFASECELSTSTVSKVELGTIPISADVLEQISERWSVSLEWLHSGKGKMEYSKNAKKMQVNDLYQDALYKELRQDKETWQQKYNELFQMFNKFMDRGPMGKGESLSITGLYKNNRKRVSVN